VPRTTCTYNNYTTVDGHIDVSVEQFGLIINSDYLFIGASPNALVAYQCCGKDVVKIKCPYDFRCNDVMDHAFSSESCFAGHDTQLHTEHRHYYQEQAQVYICDIEICDFVVCNFIYVAPCIVITRVKSDSQFWGS